VVDPRRRFLRKKARGVGFVATGKKTYADVTSPDRETSGDSSTKRSDPSHKSIKNQHITDKNSNLDWF
jgi:hypothetical protein